MTLKQTILEANKMLQEDDEFQVEEILESGMEFIESEQDISILLSYAKLCTDWGSTESEETALRHILQFDLSNSDRITSLQALLDLIMREHLNYATGPKKIKLLNESVKLASQVISLLSNNHGVDWANLLNARTTMYLDLSREGDLDAATLASEDIKNYINWLKKGINIPDYWNKENLTAFAQIDLAEANILNKTDLQKATILLKNAIQVLESNGAENWAIKRAHELLDKV